MFRTCLKAGAAFALAAGCAFADVSYDQTMKFAGGTMIESMKRMAASPAFRKRGGALGAAFQDQTFKVYLKGNKMARIGPATSVIMDLDAGTMVVLDNREHTYSRQTFEDLRERVQEAQERMGGSFEFDVKVDRTGHTRTIEGKEASETVVTMTAKSSGPAGRMVVKTDAWLTPGDAGTAELRDFMKKLAEKFGSPAIGSPGLGPAGSGLTAASRELNKLDGYALITDIRVSGISMGPGGNAGDADAPVLEMETDSTNFSTGPVDAAVFSIPAGYTEAREPMARPPSRQPPH